MNQEKIVPLRPRLLSNRVEALDRENGTMNAADSQRLLQHIRRLAGDPPGTPSDGELLQRYVDGRDEAAFAALMRRHGAMVFAVCQSVLRQHHDAEDASQATFLILTQKAGSIRRQDGLGGWLQRVAYRVALQARADKIRRQQREAKAVRTPLAEPAGEELFWSELQSILHAELAALPERFRAPLVLCYLEGLTQEEAARSTRLDGGHGQRSSTARPRETAPAFGASRPRLDGGTGGGAHRPGVGGDGSADYPDTLRRRPRRWHRVFCARC